MHCIQCSNSNALATKLIKGTNQAILSPLYALISSRNKRTPCFPPPPGSPEKQGTHYGTFNITTSPDAATFAVTASTLTYKAATYGISTVPEVKNLLPMLNCVAEADSTQINNFLAQT